MNDHQTRTLADALAGAEIVRVEELNGSGEWVDITRPKERPMTDHLDRAAEIIAPVLLRDYGMQYDTSHVTADEFMDLARDAARVLDEAGLLASPKRDAAAAAKVLREAARTLNNPSITPEIKSAVDAIFYLFDRADRVEREAQG